MNMTIFNKKNLTKLVEMNDVEQFARIYTNMHKVKYINNYRNKNAIFEMLLYDVVQADDGSYIVTCSLNNHDYSKYNKLSDAISYITYSFVRLKNEYNKIVLLNNDTDKYRYIENLFT